MKFIDLSINAFVRHMLDSFFLFKECPCYFALSVFLSFASEVLKVISFIIPLKIVLLLSSSKMPSLINHYVGFGTHDEWIIFLTLMTILAYACSVFLLYFSNIFLKKGSVSIKKKRQLHETKWNSKKSREVFAFYKIYSASVSDLMLMLICLVVIMFINPKISVVFILLVTISLYSLSFLIWLKSNFVVLLSRKYIHVVQYICQGIFFSVFIFMVLDYLFFSTIDALVAIVTIIVGRRMTTALERFVKKLVKLRLMSARAEIALGLPRASNFK